MTRSIFAVVTGFVFIALLSTGTELAIKAAIPALFDADGGTRSVTVLLLTIGYVGLYATMGCYLAARLAPRRPLQHALGLGIVGLVFNGVGSWYAWSTAPAWFHGGSLLLVMFWAWLGGRMRVQELSDVSSSSVLV